MDVEERGECCRTKEVWGSLMEMRSLVRATLHLIFKSTRANIHIYNLRHPCHEITGRLLRAMPVTDEDTAIAAIATLERLTVEQVNAKAEIKATLASNDPFIDIKGLLALYDCLYFRSLLLPRVEASWSSRLTLCAGICELVRDDQGKYRRIRLKLSEPLLKYRPRSDVINALLHEAIHAYFFITTSWQHVRGDDGTGHGAGFLLLADAVNNHGGYDVTVYHTFHDEVDSYRTHVWQCDGPCKLQAPFFGLVKRSMNRPPGKTDSWFKRHEDECGGNWTKIAEPDMTKEQVRNLGGLQRAGLQKNKIDVWVKQAPCSFESGTDNAIEQLTPRKRSRAGASVSADTARPAKVAGPRGGTVACPICDLVLADRDINNHLDQEHPP